MFGTSSLARCFRLLAITPLLLITSCKVVPPKPPLVETVAILPFDNESNDINADVILQTYVYLALQPSPYRVSDIKDVSERLAKAGIVDGGQLPALDPVKIAKDMGVQALMYGYVESFGYTNIGFYVERKVRLGLKLVDGQTGQTLWENTQTAANRKIALDKKEAQKNFLQGLGNQFVDKLFKSPLEEEAKLAVIKTLSTLPGFRFNGFPDSSGKAIKDFIKSRNK
jgi:hypothetical protein